MSWDHQYRGISIDCDTTISFVAGNPAPTLVTRAIATIDGQQCRDTLAEIMALIDRWRDEREHRAPRSP